MTPGIPDPPSAGSDPDPAGSLPVPFPAGPDRTDMVVRPLDLPYTLEIHLRGDPISLETAFRSLQPEITTADRTLIELNLTGDWLLLTISATDPTVLRAAMNSYMRWLDEALDVVDRVRT